MANAEHFTEVGWLDWAVGFRFDVATIAWLLLPVNLLVFMPFGKHHHLKARMLEVLLFLAILLLVAPNLMDTGYFRFTEKRSGYELVPFVISLNNKWDLFLTFVWSFWWLILPGFLAFYFLWELQSKYIRKLMGAAFPRPLWLHALAVFGFVALWVIAVRGGVQKTPISPAHASQWTKSSNVPLVLNTPFTLLKSWGETGLPQTKFLTDQVAESAWPWNQKYQPHPLELPPGTNVMILILESFSADYMGYFRPEQQNTPFLDSLLRESLVVQHAYANGRKSIEGVPSILAGIPTAMPTPYLSSVFSQNRIKGLGTYLKENGYTTSFYHGSENGTMGLDALCSMAGYDAYYGRDQYPFPDRDYDGHWGIWDQPYLHYVAQELNTTAQPFGSAVFTLSSHHPFEVPATFEQTFPDTLPPMLRSVRYADYALRKFFEEVQYMPWYANTLFVITSDHTGLQLTNQQRGANRFRIPMAFFAPGKPDFKGVLPVTASQTDITPSILHLLGVREYQGFGHSVFADLPRGSFALYFDLYHCIDYPYMYRLDEAGEGHLFHIPTDLRCMKLVDTLPQVELQMELKTKGFLQQYRYRVQNNKLLPQ